VRKQAREVELVGAVVGLAEKTVKNCVSSILARLEVVRRAEAAAYLARHTTIPGARQPTTPTGTAGDARIRGRRRPRAGYPARPRCG
jgi:hypothetical protein